MGLKSEFKPLKDAIINNLETKDPDEVVFIVGKKPYKAKEILKHIKKEDSIAEDIVKSVLQVVNEKIIKLNSPSVSSEDINAAIQLFKS